jgi:hypothetical protein
MPVIFLHIVCCKLQLPVPLLTIFSYQRFTQKPEERKFFDLAEFPAGFAYIELLIVYGVESFIRSNPDREKVARNRLSEC